MVQGIIVSRWLVILALLSGAMPIASYADTTETLSQITDTAERLCGSVIQSGSKDSVEIKGDVKAELSGLAKKLANLGVAGAGNIESSEYQGVVQEQLADTLKDIRKCRIAIFDILQKKLLPEAAPHQTVHRNPNALYQYGEEVAEVQGAVISQSSGIVNFQMVRTGGKADSTRDVEYQDWVLHCPGLPAPRPNEIVGTFSGMVVGETCTIIRRNL